MAFAATVTRGYGRPTMFVSVTRLRLRRWWSLPAFAVYTWRANRQVVRAAGFAGGRLAAEPRLAFWTITVWADEAAMKRYRNGGAHLKAMPRLSGWCDEAAYAHWTTDDPAVPTVAEGFVRLRDAGKLSKVRRPSAAHAAGRTTGRTAPPLAGGTLRPAHAASAVPAPSPGTPGEG